MSQLLKHGSTGTAVADVQARLAAAGFPTEPDLPGNFGDPTEAAVRAFQCERLLARDGICGPDTWQALVERGYALGDRHLYLRRPMLRGDDVAEVQARLNGLGFDAGRDDGIFGPQTERALHEFQRNAGLAVDGQCGPATYRELIRLAPLSAGSVTIVREQEAVRVAPLETPVTVIAVAPELAAIAAPIQRALAGVTDTHVIDISGSDDRVVAQHANRMGADLFIAFRVGDDDVRIHYYGTPTSSSERGRFAAELLSQAVAKTLGPDAASVGPRRTAILRETSMPAVACYLASEGDVAGMRRVLRAAPDLALATAEVFRQAWTGATIAAPK